MALYIKAHPELRDTVATVGVPVDAAQRANEARASKAADPMVLVQIGEHVFRSPAQPRAFNPVCGTIAFSLRTEAR